MRHGDHYIRLGLNTRGRRLLFHSQMSSLLTHHRIVTTAAKAKALRRVMERFITSAKRDTWRSRQKLESFFAGQPTVLALLKSAAERYKERTGGYTRLWKLGYRKGDRAPLSMIELVDAPFDMKHAFAMFQDKVEVERLKGLHVKADTLLSSSSTAAATTTTTTTTSTHAKSSSEKRQQNDKALIESAVHPIPPSSLNPYRFDWLRVSLKGLLDQDIAQRRTQGATVSPSSSSSSSPVGYLNSFLFKSNIK